MAQVVLDQVWKSFPGAGGSEVCAVRDFSLAVKEGEMLVVVGPSGCGKSTLLRLLAGLETPSQGTIRIGGRDMDGVDPADRDLAMVFQNLALYPHLSVRENLTLGLSLRGIDKAESARRVAGISDLLAIGPCLSRLPTELSGGERQRVAVGRALVRQPRVLLCDEPFSSLDAGLRLQLRRDLVRLHRQLGLTTIHVTHDQTEAMTLGQRIAVMRSGSVEQVADPLSLYRNPSNLFVAGFIGSPPMNRLQGRLVAQGEDVAFETLGGAGEPLRLALPAPVATMIQAHSVPEIVMGLRPEHIRVTAADETAQERYGVGVGLVEVVEPTGPDVWLAVRMGAAGLTARAAADQVFSPGQHVRLSFDLTKALFFHPTDGRALG